MTTFKSGRLYIIGAGFAGQTLAREIRQKGIFGEVVAFLDDDPDKIGRRLENIPVLGPIRDVARLFRLHPADEAIIAIPTASREYLEEIYQILKSAGFERIKILPGISQIIDGDARLIQTRFIDPQDLLGRTPVRVNLRESLRYLRGKRVLVTGAGGSIGSELSRQLLSAGASRLYLFGQGENSIYQIDRELRLLQEEGVGEKAILVPIIGDLKDADYMDWIMAQLKADVVFNTAAYKHVPMMEENPVAAIDNNLFGTDNLVKAASKHGVKRFVHITTDKAVEPVSVYGVSKILFMRRSGFGCRQKSSRKGKFFRSILYGSAFWKCSWFQRLHNALIPETNRKGRACNNNTSGYAALVYDNSRSLFPCSKNGRCRRKQRFIFIGHGRAC